MLGYLFLAFILASVPVILARPWVGILIWTWLGLMNPHRLLWGSAYDFPSAQVVGLATLAGFVFSMRQARIPANAPIVILVLFIVWMSITTLFALEPAAAFDQWQKVLKIQIMGFVTLALTTERKRLEVLVLVVAASIAFYGFKGGLHTVLGGGQTQVLGPEGSFITGNTAIGAALVMTLPLIRWAQLRVERREIRWGLTALMVLHALAIVGTQSRGALLGLIAMGAMLILKSRRRLPLLLGIAILAPIGYVFMPAQWHEKMSTIQTYEEDTSAMGRIVAWQFATRMALQRPMGGGYASFTPTNYIVYAPDIPPVLGKYQDAHSIYFQVLGHHGFPGLALFVALLVATWRTNSRILRATRDKPEMSWAYDLAAMVQVSLVGYMVAGAFLDLAYFDLLYTLVIVVAALHGILDRASRVPVQSGPGAANVAQGPQTHGRPSLDST